MKHTILVFVAAFSLLQCKNDSSADSGNPAPNALNATQKPIDPNVGGVGQVRNTDATQIKGLMLMNAGKGGVMDYVNKVIYMIEDPTNTVEPAYNKAVAPCHYPGETAYAVLSGKFINVGKPGNPVFQVSKVDTLMAKTPELLDRAGVPFEFWCHGSEPSWDVEICNIEGAIFYQNVSDGSAWLNPWVTPQKQGTDTWIYNIPENGSTAKAYTLKIKKAKTSDDSTGQTYDYSAEITVNGKKYKGVAVRGTAKLMGPNGNE
ncbi:MAG: hypothetical protein JNJ57_16770 [Saprospiraceae bacterium]|nr:hypothetical protein [Saprospiraceae bacterium]